MEALSSRGTVCKFCITTMGLITKYNSLLAIHFC